MWWGTNTMLFNIIFNTNQTVVFMCFSLASALMAWSLIVSQIEYYNGKAFRKSSYKRKNFFAKLFLKGLENLTSRFNIVLNFIENVLSIIFILFGILNLCFYLPIFSDIMLITGIMQLIIDTIIALENEGFKHYRNKKR